MLKLVIKSFFFFSTILAKNLHDFSVFNIHGDLINLSTLQNKIVLITNVASECGYTDSEYEGLNHLYNKFKPTNKFEILAFPCNQFGLQEPGTNDEIIDFVRKTKKGQFPIMEKSLTRTTKDTQEKRQSISDLWKWINKKTKTEGPSWNFWKYLVNGQGEIIKHYDMDKEVKSLEDTIQKEIFNIWRMEGKEL